MASRTVSLEDSAYQRLKAEKQPGESFSEVLNRILGGPRPSFTDLAGLMSNRDAERVRVAIREMRNAEGRAERRLPRRGASRGRNTRH